MRKLSENFMKDFLNPDGVLYPLLERVKQDHTLMFAIRENYINMYYRGGNILKLEEKNSGSYHAFFDPEYNKTESTLPSVPDIIGSRTDAIAWVNAFQDLKGAMDFYFSVNPKPEREFQQLIARKNNFSTVSNESEYFVSDIEFNSSDIGARFDILALQWIASQRKNCNSFRPALIELKYGDDAINGNSGIIKHLEDMDVFLGNKDKYQALLETMENQFNQLDKLELLKFNRNSNWKDVKLEREGNIPEVIFILANHNPRSSVLSSIVNSEKIKKFENSPNFDLKFYVSSFSGYALHTGCMVSLEAFRKLLKN